MIAIIDNGMFYEEHKLLFVDVTDAEEGILEAMLLTHDNGGYSNPMEVIGYGEVDWVRTVHTMSFDWFKETYLD